MADDGRRRAPAGSPEGDTRPGAAPGNQAVAYDRLAGIYARYREASPRIIAYMARLIAETGARRVLEIGCGTGDFTAAVGEMLAASGGRAAGFDVSPEMLSQARAKHGGLDLRRGDAEQRFPYGDGSFDLAFSVNVIHYIRDLDGYFREAARVLAGGGTVVTVTDSEEDVRRRTMSRYFPETVEAEFRRYHPVARIEKAMEGAGFREFCVGHTRHEGRLRPADLDRFRQRIFSALQLIPDAAFATGLGRLEADAAAGDCQLLELYTYISGRREL